MALFFRKKLAPSRYGINHTPSWRRALLTCEVLESRLAPATIAWDGGPSGTGVDWHTAANWAGDILPGPTDTATIGGAFAGVTITSASGVSIDQVTSAATLQINGGTFSVDSASSSSKLTLNGGAIGGPGDFTINSIFNWTGGDLEAGAGSTKLAASASGTFSGTGAKFLSRTLQNAGSIDYTGSNLSFGFGVAQAGVIDNLPGAVFNANTAGDFTVSNVGTHAINNAGTFNRSGTGATNVAVPFNNSGSVNVTAGTLALQDGGTHSGSFVVLSSGAAVRLSGTHMFSVGSSLSGVGRAEFNSGSATVNGTLSVGNIQVMGGAADINTNTSVATLGETSGTLGGSGIVTVTGTLNWSGGNMAAGSGKTVLAATAVGTVSSSDNKWLSRTLENSGTLDYTGSNLLFGFGAGEAGVLSNLSGGVFNINGPGSLAEANPGTHAVQNTGTINSAGSGTTIIDVPFNNNGTTNVMSGTLRLNGFGADTGAYALSSGTILELTNGHNFGVASSVTGSGTVQFVGGSSIVDGSISGPAIDISANVVINANTTVAALNMTGGSLGGSGVVTVTGTLTWSAGDMAASTGKTVLALGGTGTLSGSGSKTLSRTLENAGIIDYSGTNLTFGLGAAQAGALDNLSSGEFNVSGDGDLLVANAGSHSVVNAGTFRKSGGTDSTILGVPFVNTGTLEILAVNVTAQAPITLSGTVNASGGQLTVTAGGSMVGALSITTGTINLTNGTFTLQNGASSSGNGILIMVGATVTVNTGDSASLARLTHRRGALTGAGTLTITNTYTWAAAASIGGGTTILAPGATGTLSGNGNKFLGRTLENQGTLTYAGTGLQFGFGIEVGVLNNTVGAVLNLNGDGDLNANTVNTHAFNNSGTVNRSGTGVTTVGITANNNGAINIIGGILSLDAGGNHSGSFAPSGSATLSFGGGTHTLTAPSSISGAGTVQFNGGTTTVNGALAVSFIQIASAAIINTNTSVSTVGFTAGSLGGTGIVTVTNSLSWSAGNMAAGTGKTVIAPSATGTLSGLGNKYLSRTLENSGTLNYTGANLAFGFGGSQAGVVDNLSGGTFNVTSDGDLIVFFAGSHAVNNSGTINRSGVGATDIDIPLNNSGSVNVSAGTLGLDAGGVHAGSFSVAGGSTLRLGGTHVFGAASAVTGGGAIDVNNGSTTIAGTLAVNTARILGGSLILNSAATVSTLDQTSGSLGGSGDITVTSSLTWSGGDMATGGGKTVLASTGIGSISGSNNKWLSRTLESAGNLSYTGTNFLFGFGAGQAGVVHNLAGGTFNAVGGGDLTQANPGSHAVINAGTFTRSGTGATTVAVPFDNSNTVNVTGGTLSLDNGGTSSGAFGAAGGTTLRFGGGAHNLLGSSSFSGSGTVQIAGGTTTVDGSISVATLDISAAAVLNANASISTVNLSGGSLGGNGIITVTSALNWSGGNMAAGTGKTVLAATTTGTITGAANKWLSRTLENSGTLDYNGSNLRFGFGAGQAGVIDNLLGGMFTADGGGDFGLANAGTHAINNAGTFNRIGAGSTSVAFGIAVNNSGTFDIQTGSLDLGENFNQTGGLALLGVGTTLTSAGDVVIGGGSLRGFGTVDSNLINSGQVRPGGAGVAGTIIVTGDYSQSASGTLLIELGGTGAGTFDVLSVGGSATLDGTLNVSLINSFTPALNDSFVILTFASVAGTFPTISGLNIGGGKELDPVYTATDFHLDTIVASPIPPADGGRLEGQLNDSANPSVARVMDASEGVHIGNARG